MALKLLPLMAVSLFAVQYAAALDLEQLLGGFASDELCKDKIFETYAAAEQAVLCDGSDSSDQCLIQSLRALDSVELVALRAQSSCSATSYVSNAILADDHCVSAVKDASFTVQYAIVTMKDSVAKCRATAAASASCVSRVTLGAQAIDTLKTAMEEALAGCGMRNAICKTGLQEGVEHLAAVQNHVSSTKSTCAASDNSECAVHLTNTVKELTKAVMDTSKAVPHCLFKPTDTA